jgi:hypothetical protein
MMLGPLLHIKNDNLPRGVRKVETQLHDEDFNSLKLTIPVYERQSLLDSLRYSVSLYRQLRTLLFTPGIELKRNTEQKVMEYFKEIEQRNN